MIQLFVTGRMASGKDTFADYLVAHHDFVKSAFADGIRATIIQFNPDYKPKSDRALEIDIGNTFRRWFDDYVWIRWALADLDEQYEDRAYQGLYNGGIPERREVISDGRFPLEREVCVKQRGFVHIHIYADPIIRKQRLLSRDGTFNEVQFNSPSDCLIPIHSDTIVITNNGTLDEFYRKIDELLETLQ